MNTFLAAFAQFWGRPFRRRHLAWALWIVPFCIGQGWWHFGRDSAKWLGTYGPKFPHSEGAYGLMLAASAGYQALIWGRLRQWLGGWSFVVAMLGSQAILGFFWWAKDSFKRGFLTYWAHVFQERADLCWMWLYPMLTAWCLAGVWAYRWQSPAKPRLRESHPDLLDDL